MTKSPRLNKVVKTSKQKAVPVRIVSDTADTAPQVKRGVDKWEAQEALRTLQRADEIRSNKPLMRAAKKEAAEQVKALSKVK